MYSYPHHLLDNSTISQQGQARPPVSLLVYKGSLYVSLLLATALDPVSNQFHFIRENLRRKFNQIKTYIGLELSNLGKPMHEGYNNDENNFF